MDKKLKEPQITFDELMRELSKFKCASKKKLFLTDQQMVFVKAARAKKMHWFQIANLFNTVKGWNKMKATSIAAVYRRQNKGIK
jgi:hypothetical protein